MVFFLLKTNLNFEAFKIKVLEEINKSNPELDTSEMSFFNKIITSLAYGVDDFVTLVDTLVAKNSFDSENSSNLDFILEIFNIKRRNIYSEIKKLDFYYTGSIYFTIKAGAYILKDELFYENRNKVTVDANSRDKKYSLELSLIEGFSLTDLEMLDFGSFKVSKNDLTFDYDFYAFSNLVLSSIFLLSFETVISEKESDSSYLNRAKNILQFLSSDTNYKIKNSILEIDGVSDVILENKDFDTFVTIIPKTIESLDNIIDYASEIVDYYKNSNFVFKKPILNSIKITNVLTQIDSSLHSDITVFINSYIKELFYKEFIFDRNDFEFKLFEYINKFTSSFTFNKEKIEVIYNCYLNCDLEELVFNGKIYTDSVKKFPQGLFYCEEVS